MTASCYRRPIGGRTTISILFAAALGLLVIGCASRKQVTDLQDDMTYVSVGVDSLQQQQRSITESLAVIETEVRAVQTSTEYGSSTLQEKVEALAARLDDILTRMDRTLAPLEEFMRQQAGTDSGKTGTMGVDFYDAAARDLSLGNYDLAEVGFLQYLESYPNSDLADDARYGLAETYYARKRYDDAAEEYQRVITANPKGSKTPAAYLKLGLCQKALQNPRDAGKTWQELMDKFPASEEAKVAKQRIDELKQP